MYRVLIWPLYCTGQVYSILIRSLVFIIYCVLGDVCTGFWWGNLREKRALGRPRRKWVDNIKIYLQ